MEHTITLAFDSMSQYKLLMHVNPEAQTIRYEFSTPYHTENATWDSFEDYYEASKAWAKAVAKYSKKY